MTALAFCMIYVDDCGAATINDLLYHPDGSPFCGRWCDTDECYVPCDGAVEGAMHVRRPDMHYMLALRAIARMGHASARGKGVPPCDGMDLLGVHIDVVADERRLSQLKCDTYGAAARAASRRRSRR